MAECSACPFNGVAEALEVLTKTYSIKATEDKTVKSYSTQVAQINRVEYLIKNLSARKKVKKATQTWCNAAKAVAPEFAELVEAANKFLAKLNKVSGKDCPNNICLKCSQASNDDNLSRQGQTFVMLDAFAGNALSSLGADPAEGIDSIDDGDDNGHKDGRDNEAGELDGNGESGHTSGANDEAGTGGNHFGETSEFFTHDDDPIESDNRQNSGDWLAKNVIRDVHHLDEEGNTNLPAHIEDYLRKILHSFSSLDVFEQILIFSQMCGQNFTSFGSMKWVPKEFKSPQTKQLVSQRWDRLCQKFPIAAALRKAKPGEGLATEMAKHFSDMAYEQGEFDFGLPNEVDVDSQGESTEK